MLNLLRPFAPWAATTVLSALLLITNRNPPGEVLRAHLSEFLIYVASPFSAVGEAVTLWRENRELRELLAGMTLELAAHNESWNENERLRRMMEFQSQQSYQLIPAEVVGFTEDLDLRGLLIDKGSEDSVQVDMAVITVEGIVGRIYRVSTRSSIVQLITDLNIGVATRLQTSREDGIIHAGGSGSLTMDMVPVSATVNIGDTIVTSGLDRVFPKGLPVGTVAGKSPNENGWLWDIKAAPFAQFNKLEEVFIVLMGAESIGH